MQAKSSCPIPKALFEKLHLSLTAAQSLYYRWSKDFLEAGKKRLAGDTARQATNAGEVKDLRAEALALKELVADLSLVYQSLSSEKPSSPRLIAATLGQSRFKSPE